MRSVRIALVLVAAVMLVGCPSTSTRVPPSTDALPPIGAPDLRGARIYNVDPDASDIYVQVFRGGTLARLGHNHVMSSKELSGKIWMHTDLERSGFELGLPVATLAVDDRRARVAAGPEFPGEIPEDDREGTRKNMLRAEVLDAEHHPRIELRSVRITGSIRQAQIRTRVTIKGATRDVTVPAVVEIAGKRLTAAGQFDILQTDFGIKPFSIGMGALEVQDRLHIVFRVVANAT